MSEEKARRSERIETLPKKKMAVEPFAINLFLINNQYLFPREWFEGDEVVCAGPFAMERKSQKKARKCEERKESVPNNCFFFRTPRNR